MNLESILLLVWQVLNTPAGITAMAGLLLWGLNRLYAVKPAWAAFEGAIISGIKFAEKKVPDGSESKGLKRLDEALKYVLKIYEEAKGKRPSPKTVASIKEGIQIVHNELEVQETLK